MKYRDLRDFAAKLEGFGELSRVTAPVSPHLEMTALADRVLRQGGPALLFENPTGYRVPVLANLFGTPHRVALGMGAADISELRGIGQLLANLREPEPPKSVKDAGKLWTMGKALWDMKPATLRSGPCQEVEQAAAGPPRPLPGSRAGGRRDRPGPVADPDLLAGRCRPPGDLGPGRHARPA